MCIRLFSVATSINLIRNKALIEALISVAKVGAQ